MNRGYRVRTSLRTAADPLLSPFVDLLLPERDGLLQAVDRVPAGGERVVAMRSRDGDRDARLADPHQADAMVDRDLAEVVARLQIGGDLGHHLLGHAAVG